MPGQGLSHDSHVIEGQSAFYLKNNLLSTSTLLTCPLPLSQAQLEIQLGLAPWPRKPGHLEQALRTLWESAQHSRTNQWDGARPSLWEEKQSLKAECSKRSSTTTHVVTGRRVSEQGGL